jgi:hypothetical protein
MQAGRLASCLWLTETTENLLTRQFYQVITCIQKHTFNRNFGSSVSRPDNQGEPLLPDGVVSKLEILRKKHAELLARAHSSNSSVQATQRCLYAEINKLSKSVSAFERYRSLQEEVCCSSCLFSKHAQNGPWQCPHTFQIPL